MLRDGSVPPRVTRTCQFRAILARSFSNFRARRARLRRGLRVQIARREIHPSRGAKRVTLPGDRSMRANDADRGDEIQAENTSRSFHPLSLSLSLSLSLFLSLSLSLDTSRSRQTSGRGGSDEGEIAASVRSGAPLRAGRHTRPFGNSTCWHSGLARRAFAVSSDGI